MTVDRYSSVHPYYEECKRFQPRPQFRRDLRNDGCTLKPSATVTRIEQPIATLRALHPGALPAEVEVPGPGLVIGRDARCSGLVIRRDGVSRQHCWVGRMPDGHWAVRDLGSRNGVYVNGQCIDGEQILAAGDVIGLGRSRLADLSVSINGHQRQVVLGGPGPWRLGRDLDCELSLPADPGVSQHHATLSRHGQDLVLEDSGSRNGTWLEGRRIRRTRLHTDAIIIMAGSRLRLDAIAPEPRWSVTTLDQALGVKADALAVAAESDHGLNVEIQPGRLQGLVMADPRQRRALLEVLAGMRAPSAGELAWTEPELNATRARLRTRVGRVSRRDIPVCNLFAADWLEQQASLAAAGDLTRTARRERVATVLAELDASHLGTLKLDRLTALEQALVQLASELLTSPGLILVDLPTVLDQAVDRAELVDRLQALAGPRLTVVVALDTPLDILPQAAHIPIAIQPSARQPARKADLMRPRGFSAAATTALLLDQLRGWRRQPLMLFETLVLPVVLVAGLWLALPDHADAWIVLVSLVLAAALGAAFQVSRQPGRLLRTARRHLLLDDALLAVFAAACLVAAVQTLLGLTVIAILPGTSPSMALVLAAVATALVGTALGLVCGVIAGQRNELALLLVAGLGTLVVVTQSLAGFDHQPGRIMALASPLPWSLALADMAANRGLAALGAGILALQIAGILLLARHLLRRRL